MNQRKKVEDFPSLLTGWDFKIYIDGESYWLQDHAGKHFFSSLDAVQEYVGRKIDMNDPAFLMRLTAARMIDE